MISLNVEKHADVIYAVPKPEERTDTYLKNEFIRVTDEIRERGGMPQLNHPRDPQTAISWNPNFMDIITIFETMEIWNGSKPMVPGSSSAQAVGMWVDMLEDGIYLPGTTGSDTHNIRCNDYKYFYESTQKLMDELKALKEGDALLEDADVKGFLQICDRLLPDFEKWAKRNLTSGGVRTFVHVDALDGAGSIVEQMKKGHMTLSDGPLLFPVMEIPVQKTESKEEGGEQRMVLPGEIVKEPGEIHINLHTNRRLKTMRILKKGRKMADYSLLAFEKACDGYMDYSHVLTPKMLQEMGMEWQDEDYLVLIAFDDCTNIAMANPFFISQH